MPIAILIDRPGLLGLHAGEKKVVRLNRCGCHSFGSELTFDLGKRRQRRLGDLCAVYVARDPLERLIDPSDTRALSS